MAGIHILHHYTDKPGYDGIKKSNMIRASRVATDDAFYGEGVYLTSLDPGLGRKRIVKNNWDGSGGNERAFLTLGKTDRVLQVHIPKGDANIKKVESGDRDIYLYTGDLNLNSYKYSSILLENGGRHITIGAPGDTGITYINEINMSKMD